MASMDSVSPLPSVSGARFTSYIAEAIGGVFLRRTAAEPFSEKQIAVLRTLADQAVIAIQNVRLFEELQARTAEVTEALEQQTATSELLEVISSSKFDIQPVLDTLVDSAARLCEAESAFVYRRDGDIYRVVANRGFSDEYVQFIRKTPIPPARGTCVGRTALTAAASSCCRRRGPPALMSLSS